MKRKILALCLLASMNVAEARTLHQLDPEMTGAEYRSMFAANEKVPAFKKRVAADPLHTVLEIGKRNLDWIELINSKRDAAHQLHLTSPETTPAYPIDAPGKSNPNIIMNRLATLKQTMPASMAAILFGTDALPDYPPVDDQTFITNAATMNRIYEAASRWLLEEPYMEYMKSMARLDIRGYYYLNKESDLEHKLAHWSSLEDATQKKYTEWLVGECYNSLPDKNQCRHLLASAITHKQVLNFHKEYVTTAASLFNHFFEIQNTRPEAIWNNKNPNLMIMPFTLPDSTAVEDWLKTNVEDEFHFNNWSLQINFSRAENLAKIVFEPGATPHVNDLGGDTITMDANRNLNDYEVAWTIRHEFAHIIGFPDCYIEFYDTEQEAMINYQIDITNLMCSRRGHLLATHFDQLQKHYYQ